MELLLKSKNIDGIGSLGKLFVNGELFLYTVEKEWKNNEPFHSCIPAGTYDLKPHKSPKHGDCFALENPNVGVTIFGPSQRTHCLIHVANWASEVHGCIGVGLSFHPSKWGVANSAKALAELKKKLNGKSVKLIIERD